MKFTLLTYNLHYNQASAEVDHVLRRYKPDLICFQEIITNDENLSLIEECGYRLADFSNSFIRGSKVFGVATFYRTEKFRLKHSRSFSLPSSLYQMITYILHARHNPRTVLKNEFLCVENNKRLITYNIHLTPVATNSHRQKQIVNTLDDLHLGNTKDAIVVAGDFNYPYGRKKFEEIVAKYGLKEATNNVLFTLERSVLKLFSIKLKLDYVLYNGNLSVISNKRIDVRDSDHYPLLTELEF
jgi:endonuclease/exonuclease/phosphatase family metal-dependent hydrolase